MIHSFIESNRSVSSDAYFHLKDFISSSLQILLLSGITISI